VLNRLEVPDQPEMELLQLRDAARELGVSYPCVFRGKAITIPKSSRSPFRNEADHDSGMMPITDSDFKPITFRRRSEL